MSRSVIPDFGPLRRQKHAFLSELQGWIPAQTSFRCAPGSWCALEVLDHVVKAERGILADIQWNLLEPKDVPAVSPDSERPLDLVHAHTAARSSSRAVIGGATGH